MNKNSNRKKKSRDSAKSLHYFFSIWVAAVMIFLIKGDLSFGHGLGDIYYMLSLSIFSIAIFFIYWRHVNGRRNAGNISWKRVYLVGAIFIIIATSLKLSFLRGPEYAWNGSVVMSKK